MGHLGATFAFDVYPGYPYREEVWKAGPVANPLVSQHYGLRGA